MIFFKSQTSMKIYTKRTVFIMPLEPIVCHKWEGGKLVKLLTIFVFKMKVVDVYCYWCYWTREQSCPKTGAIAVKHDSNIQPVDVWILGEKAENKRWLTLKAMFSDKLIKHWVLFISAVKSSSH